MKCPKTVKNAHHGFPKSESNIFTLILLFNHHSNPKDFSCIVIDLLLLYLLLCLHFSFSIINFEENQQIISFKKLEPQMFTFFAWETTEINNQLIELFGG